MSNTKAPIIAAVAFGVLAIGGIKAATSGGEESPKSNKASQVKLREGCETVTVVASSEKAELMRGLAGSYNASGRKVDGVCYDAVVNSVASGVAEKALAAGWNKNIDGPEPTVWTPAASTWISMLKRDLVTNDRAPLINDDQVRDSSIASTPLVLAMPKPMAEALGWPKKAIGWSDILNLANNPAGWGSVGHPEWGRFTLGKTNPNISTSGLAATVGAFVAATGRSSDLALADLEDPKLLKFATEVEKSVVHYGDTTLTFLSNLNEAAAKGQGMTYVSAVAVEEKSVIDYNLGNPTGDPKTLKKGKAPKVPLVAVYPKEGTLNSDSPYAILDADWVTESQKKGAEDFAAFLREDDQQAKFTNAGFRTFDGKAGNAIKADPNVSQDPVTNILSAPSGAVLDGVRATWTKVRKPAKVLLVTDVSGSMGEDAGYQSKSKLELAQTAAVGAIDQFTDHDEVGLWAFATGLGKSGYVEHANIGKLNQAHKKKIAGAINNLVPRGGTPLYASTRAAAQTLRKDCTDGYICAVVVLTDGRNEDPADNDLDSLLTDLATGSEANPLRVFTIAYGDGADLDTLKELSAASSAAAYDSRDASKIDKVFADVLSNF